MNKVFLNNQIVDADTAKVDAGDAGFLYGAGLFETLRCKDGAVFALEDHIDRLIYSAGVLGVRLTGDKKYLIDSIYKTLDANELADARIRLTATNGTVTDSKDQNSPTLLISAAQFQGYPEEYYKKGVMAALSSNRQNPHDPTSGHKCTSYFSRLLALGDAHKKGAAEAIWFTVDNKIAEGCVSNIFIVKDSIVYTPTLKTPVLPGVTRKYICNIAPENAIELVEKDLFINDLLDADEVFLTNVIMQVLPVIKIEAHDVKDGNCGPITKKLSGLFSQAMDRYCRSYSREK